MKTKIYTRTGDKGETSLYSGQRVSKDNPSVEAIGTVDECNCAIGIAVSLMGTQPIFDKARGQLEQVQHALFDVGAALATPLTKAANNKLEKTRFDNESTAMLEEWMDVMDAELPQLHSFILPGGNSCGAVLHLARSICRRAERLVVPLHKKGDVSESVLIYLNRLSDYLFMLSRYVNALTHTPETQWKPHHK